MRNVADLVPHQVAGRLHDFVDVEAGDVVAVDPSKAAQPFDDESNALNSF